MSSDRLLEAVREAHRAQRLQWNGAVAQNTSGNVLKLSTRGRAAMTHLLYGAPEEVSWREGSLLQVLSFYLLDVGQLSPLVDYSALLGEAPEFVQPSVVSLEITRFCNLRCVHCYNDSGVRPEGELTEDRKSTLVEYLLRWGVRSLIITGGEPTLDKSFYDLLDLAGDYGASVKVTTNGWSLTDRFLGAVRDKIIEQVDLSIDGADEETHDRFRARKGSFARALKSIKRLQVCRPAVLRLNVAVHSEALPQMDAMVRLAMEHKFDSVSFKPVTSTGRPEARWDFCLSPQELMVFRTRRADLAKAYGKRILVEGNILGGKGVPDATLDQIGCNAARRSMLILSTGEMTPCDALGAAGWAPNVSDMAPMKAWLDHPLFAGFRSLKQEEGGGPYLGCPGMRFAAQDKKNSKEAAARGGSVQQLVRRLGRRLDVGAGAEAARIFLKHSGTALDPGWPEAMSAVAPGPLPVELSFSQSNSNSLRILTEPCRPGEGILARTSAALAAVGAITLALFSESVAARAERLVRRLLPDGEEIGGLHWRSGVWLAIKADPEALVLRAYVNARLRDASDRWRRIARALSRCGYEGAAQAVWTLRRAVGEFMEPVGICVDFHARGVAAARLHCVTGRVSPFRLLQLLDLVEAHPAMNDVADFLEIFDILETDGPCPLLISFGLDRGDIGALKIDVDLWGLEPNPAMRQERAYLDKVEARFGPIEGYRRVAEELAGVDARYIGMTALPERSFVNVYFSCPDVASHRQRSADEVQRDALSFVETQLGVEGGVLMDTRSILEEPRPVPEGWVDLYMSSLLVQEFASFSPLGESIIAGARAYIAAARDSWFWRYLPDLPGDLDDTSMAWLALDPANRQIDEEVVARLQPMLNDDGGFPTFICDDFRHQSSHPAVTLNVARALDRAQIACFQEQTDTYLKRWLFREDFPDCEWLGAPVFPLFLFSRAPELVRRLGPAAQRRLVELTLGMQRSDASWGRGLADSLDTSLAVLLLDSFGLEIPASREVRELLLSCQLDDGGWGWSALYSDGDGTWYGQRALTTLFALRALQILDTL